MPNAQYADQDRGRWTLGLAASLPGIFTGCGDRGPHNSPGISCLMLGVDHDSATIQHAGNPPESRHACRLEVCSASAGSGRRRCSPFRGGCRSGRPAAGGAEPVARGGYPVQRQASLRLLLLCLCWLQHDAWSAGVTSALNPSAGAARAYTFISAQLRVGSRVQGLGSGFRV